jgi:hypothetical protein
MKNGLQKRSNAALRRRKNSLDGLFHWKSSADRNAHVTPWPSIVHSPAFQLRQCLPVKTATWTPPGQAPAFSLRSGYGPRLYIRTVCESLDSGPVTQLNQFPAPVLSAQTGRHADPARGQRSRKRQPLRTVQGITKHDLAVAVRAVQTKGMRCQIDPDRCNVQDGSSCSADEWAPLTICHIDAVGGRGGSYHLWAPKRGSYDP